MIPLAISDFGESKIFKDESVLSAEHLPALLPHREGQIKELVRNILPTSKGRKPQNTFLYGPPGIGKTAVTKYVFREFEEYSDRVKCIYLNCWYFKTAVAVFSEIARMLGIFVQRRGWSKDEIIARFSEGVKKSKKGLVLCLDEVDQLESDTLYDLLRIGQYVDTPVGLIFISNFKHVFAEAEPRIRSSLAVEELEFRPYSLMEMKDILAERARYAFHSIDSAALLICANRALEKGGDVRVGLQCMLKAGRAAEDANARKVNVEHVKKVLRSVGKVKPKILKERITDVERTILKILGDGKKWKSGLLYEEYKKLSKRFDEEPLTARAFRSYVNHLAEIGLVKIGERRIGSHRVIWKV